MHELITMNNNVYMERVRKERKEKKVFYFFLIVFFLFFLLGLWSGYKSDWTFCDDPQVCM